MTEIEKGANGYSVWHKERVVDPDPLFFSLPFSSLIRCFYSEDICIKAYIEALKTSTEKYFSLFSLYKYYIY